MLLKSHSSQSSRLITVVSDSIHTVDAYALHIAKLFGSLIDTLAGIALLYQLMGILGSLILGPFICELRTYNLTLFSDLIYRI